MPKERVLTGVPESDVEEVIADFESDGAEVVKERQTDGTYTIKARFPGPEEFSKERNPRT